MKKCIALLVPLIACLASGCDSIGDMVNAERIRGSGRVIQERRDVHGFAGVRFAAVGELSLRQGDQESLIIEAEDNLIPRIQTEVEGGKLVIRTERGVSISPTVTIRYTLVAKDLTELELSGSGTILAAPIRSQDFRLRLSGSGEIRLDELTADSLTSVISGSGSINVHGRTEAQNIRISGSGDYDARNLRSRRAEISVSGSGDSKVWAEDELSVDVSGSGGVDYYGNPKVSKRISGSGSLHNLGERP